MAFTLPSSYQVRPGQPQVLDGDFISKEEGEAIASKLFKVPMILKTLGKGGARVPIFPMLINKAYSH